jgi:dihydrodipicolinate synthase/N-acetylneuraminate lyase
LPTKDIIQARSLRLQQLAMSVMIGGRGSTEAGVVIMPERLQEGITGFNRGDARQAQLLDEPVLQRAIGRFDSPLGRRRVGANALDI